MSTNEELQAQIHVLHSYLKDLIGILPKGPHYNNTLTAVTRRLREEPAPVGLSKEAIDKAISRVYLP